MLFPECLGPNIGYLIMRHTHPKTQAIAIVLGYQPELDDKTLMLKAPLDLVSGDQ